MLDSIGSVAGVIWRYLEDHNETTLTKLTREIGENERTVSNGCRLARPRRKIRFRETETGYLYHLKNTTTRYRSRIDFGRSTKLDEATSPVNSGADVTAES